MEFFLLQKVRNGFFCSCQLIPDPEAPAKTHCCSQCWGTGLIGGWVPRKTIWLRDISISFEMDSDKQDFLGSLSAHVSAKERIRPGDLLIQIEDEDRWAISSLKSTTPFSKKKADWKVSAKCVARGSGADQIPLNSLKSL